MKSLFAGFLPLFAAAVTLNAGGATHGQSPGMFGPGASGAYGPGPQMAPAMPASPLAGGRPAMQGGAYMDVHGNPIVVPAQYCQDGGCYGGGCYDGGGYSPGDGMYADFGGYGADQCGPHYFDFAAGFVAMGSEDRFIDVGPLGSVGVGNNAPRVLDPAVGSNDFKAGFEITGRLDFGPLSVLEATYLGIGDIDSNQTVRSVDVTDPPTDFQLFSAFSDFGLGTLIPGLDDGSVYALSSHSELHSTELSYRRYWVGANPRVTGTYLLGFRYVRLTDDLILNSFGLIDPVNTGSVTRAWEGENDLLGAQIGGDMSICMRQGLRWNTEMKAGLYNNHYKFRNVGDFVDGAVGSPADFDVTAAGDQVAFATEAKTELVFDILPSWSVRSGYRVIYLNSLVTPGGNVNTNDITSTIVATQSHALFHGFHGGVEYVW